MERDSILKRNKSERKWLPYGIILGIVLMAELSLFQFSTWKTIFCEPVILAENVVTNEMGIFETETVILNTDVKNINVNMTIERYDRAKVTVMLTDAGDYYEYALPEYEVVSGLEGDGYQNIYPFGTVNTLRVQVAVPEGTVGHIDSIVVNDNRSMDFKILRVAILFGVFSFGYAIFADRPIMQMCCMRGNKKQSFAIVIVILGITLIVGFLLMSNPLWQRVQWQHHKQYQELAHCLARGTVVIDDEPDAALLAKENPYDTGALFVEEIPFRMDYALYDGNYYAYFGIIPEILFFLPYYLLTGHDLPNYVVIFAFYVMMLVGIFGLLWELIHRFFKKVPFVWYLIMATAIALLPNYVFIAGRPDIYNIPVIGGNAFAFLGAFFWTKACWGARYKKCFLALGSASVACIMGCRPQMILYGIAVFFAIVIPFLFKSKGRMKELWKNNFSKAGITHIAAFLIPIVFVGVIVFWYNLARFGSGFEFGATYSLTSNDMNNRGFNFSRVFRGLYSFFMQPPAIHASFPFLESAKLEGNYMGKNIVEFCYGGIFMICPWLWSLLYVALGGYKKYTKETSAWILSLCTASVIIAVFDINAAGVLQRYMGDMVLGLVLAATIVLFGAMEASKEMEMKRWIGKVTYLSVLVSLVFSFLIWITSENSICLQEYNPVLFHEIWSYFKI